MNEKRMKEALDAIHDEAVKLLAVDSREKLHEGLHLIISLARHQFDVRSDSERKGAARSEGEPNL